MCAAGLRERYSNLEPVVEDLLLLDSHQILTLAARAPGHDLGVVLQAYPFVTRFRGGIAAPLMGASSSAADEAPFPKQLLDRPDAIGSYSDGGAVNGECFELI